MSFPPARRRPAILAGLLTLGSLAGLPALAPSSPDRALAAGAADSIVVTAVDHRFEGLPISVPRGTRLRLANAGTEVHELVVLRRKDAIAEDWATLLALPADELASRVNEVGRLVAAPGAEAEESIVAGRKGAFIAICRIPVGQTELRPPDVPPTGPPTGSATPSPAGSQAVVAAGPSTSPSTGPVASPVVVPTHADLGMVQPFEVTAVDSTPGPVPSPLPSPVASSGPGRVIELEMTSTLQFQQGGALVSDLPVTVGETIRFRVTNSAGFLHDIWIGRDAVLAAGETIGLPGLPEFDQGTQEFTWVVPADAAELKFGCTVPGHYQIMQGTFSVQG